MVDADTGRGRRSRVCVLAPAPLLTVTLESTEPPGDAEVHLHPGGQGFWIGRLMAELGVEVVLCATFGGETGNVIRGLLQRERMTVRCVETAGTNGAYVDDRRSGERLRIAAMCPSPMSRHEVDELYGATLVEGLDADACVLGGPGPERTLAPDFYRRLAGDLVANGRRVIADLSGDTLRAAAAGKATVIKVSDEELARDGLVGDDTVSSLVDAMAGLRRAGAEAVVCTRAHDAAIALFDDRSVTVRGPVLEATDSRGAGDSFTAGMAAAVAMGRPFEPALRLGAAAGILNVTRRGLGTGGRDEIERLADHIEIENLEPHTGGVR